MTIEDYVPAIILVVEDVHETRDGIETLLMADGYSVALARDEADAIESAQRTKPDLILVSLAGSPREVIFSALSIRLRSEVGEGVPVVVFCVEGIDEGDEVAIGRNVHLTHPDNFNQLRSIIARLLNRNSIAREVGILTPLENKFMSTINNHDRPFAFRFIDTKPRILLELKNTTETTLRSIEVMTIFLKDEEAPDGGPAQVQIRFDAIKSMHPKDTAVLAHRTWINGTPVNDARDQIARLKVVAGEFSPYVLDISWENAEGKARFQRIPVGH